MMIPRKKSQEEEMDMVLNSVTYSVQNSLLKPEIPKAEKNINRFDLIDFCASPLFLIMGLGVFQKYGSQGRA